MKTKKEKEEEKQSKKQINKWNNMHEPISYGELTHFFVFCYFQEANGIWYFVQWAMIETENLLKLLIVQVFVYSIHWTLLNIFGEPLLLRAIQSELSLCFAYRKSDVMEATITTIVR